MTAIKILRVGLIGCGEISQVAHVPTLGFLSDYFQITYLCDVSDDALEHCRGKVIGTKPKITRNAEDLCASPDVDVVMIANSDAFHVPHTLLGLKYNKVVFIEKPMALSLKDADSLIEMEKQSSGKVMVGYMRRYAAGFLDAIKEIGSLDKVCYARVRDIVGPNSAFVSQSGTFPRTFSDYRPEDSKELASKTNEFLDQALTRELGIPVTAATALHALFQYPSFAVSYESGIDGVPRFDASIEVFGEDKTVKICFDSPYVKGLPTNMHIREKLSDGSFRDSLVRKTYEDAYTLEMKELYAFVVDGKPAKTTSEDAKKDLEIFGMFMKAAVAAPVGETNGFHN
ncbi:hypothetical protein N7486_010470 [Penicillium sp. IBT 16267x]|nr:hypothetical protein N7486_010470 [Penicillium sp. IBT 16267x]